MTQIWARCVRDTPLETGGRRALLEALARYAGEDGVARVSKATLALATGQHEKTVQANLRKLSRDEDLAGLLTVSDGAGGRGKAGVYRLSMRHFEPLAQAVDVARSVLHAGAAKALSDAGLTGAPASLENGLKVFEVLREALELESQYEACQAVEALERLYALRAREQAMDAHRKLEPRAQAARQRDASGDLSAQERDKMQALLGGLEARAKALSALCQRLSAISKGERNTPLSGGAKGERLTPLSGSKGESFVPKGERFVPENEVPYKDNTTESPSHAGAGVSAPGEGGREAGGSSPERDPSRSGAERGSGAASLERDPSRSAAQRGSGRTSPERDPSRSAAQRGSQTKQAHPLEAIGARVDPVVASRHLDRARFAISAGELVVSVSSAFDFDQISASSRMLRAMADGVGCSGVRVARAMPSAQAELTAEAARQRIADQRREDRGSDPNSPEHDPSRSAAERGSDPSSPERDPSDEPGEDRGSDPGMEASDAEA